MIINPKKTFVNEGMMSDKYIKKTKEKIDYSLDKAIENNDKKAVEDIREKCIKAIKHVEATKSMRTVNHYFNLPEWILRFLLYCIGIIWIKIDLRGKTKFTEEEILKIEKELKDALKKCDNFLKKADEEVEQEVTLVHCSKNPLILDETVMGKILKSSPRYHFIPSMNKATVYDLKNKKKYTGKDAYDIIKDIDKGNYVDNNTSVYGEPKSKVSKPDDLQDKFKNSKNKEKPKTVNFTTVKDDN